MNYFQIMLEVGKTILPIVATAAIAWFTVTAALRRFKAERTWERRLDAYSQLVTSVRHVQSVVGRWLDEMDQRHGLVSVVHFDTQARHFEKFELARRDFESAYAVAQLLLSTDSVGPLGELSRQFEKVDREGPWKALNDAYGEIDEVMGALLQAGRKSLD